MQRDEPLLIKQYLEIFEATGYVIFTTDDKGTFNHVSNSVVDLTGYTPEEIIGQHFTFLIKPEWHKRVTNFYIKQLESGHHKTTYEFPIITKSNEYRWVEQTVIWHTEGASRRFQAIVRDVTARREDTVRSQALFEQTNDAVFILDLEGSPITVNQRAVDMLGYSVKEFKKLSFRDIVDPSELSSSRNVLQQVLTNNAPTLYRRTLRRKNGEALLTEVNIQLVRDESGKPIHIQSVVRDVSHRIDAERALRISEERNRALLLAQPDLMFVMKRDGTYTEFDGIEDTTPSSQDAMMGQNIRNFGFDEDTLKKTFAAIEAAIETREAQTYFYEPSQEDATGMASSFEARVVALNDEEVMFIIRDVSDLRQAQSQLAEQVQQLKILTAVDEELAERLDINYVVNMALDSALRLSNAASGYIALLDETKTLRVVRMIGSHRRNLVNNNLRSGSGAIGRVIRNRKAELITDVTKDPDYIVNRGQTKAQITIPLLSQEQELIGVLNIEVDRYGVFTQEIFDFLKLITNRISVAIENARLYNQVEDQFTQLKTLYDRVSNLEQLKTDMIRIASHDLRNPLSTIMGYIELMTWDIESLEGETAKSLLHQMTEIDDASKRMQKIILDILSLERIQEVAEQETFDVFDLKKVVQTVFTELQPEATIKSRKMNLAVPDENVFVHGHDAHIHEAVTNLIGNAIKYTVDGNTINVRLTKEMEEACFEVEDDGIGIPENQQERLFDPFYRAKSSETEDIEGTGLGLHLVKNIIERHKGRMHFNSVYKEGSTFGFRIPFTV